VYIFLSVKILAHFFTLNISTFFTSKVPPNTLLLSSVSELSGWRV